MILWVYMIVWEGDVIGGSRLEVGVGWGDRFWVY